MAYLTQNHSYDYPTWRVECRSSRVQPFLSTANGSTRVARHAGTRHAASATTAMTAATSANVSGSVGVTLKSRDSHQPRDHDRPDDAGDEADPEQREAADQEMPEDRAAGPRRAPCGCRSPAAGA